MIATRSKLVIVVMGLSYSVLSDLALVEHLLSVFRIARLEYVPVVFGLESLLKFECISQIYIDNFSVTFYPILIRTIFYLLALPLIFNHFF